MRTKASNAVALSLAIAGAVASPLRSDTVSRKGSTPPPPQSKSDVIHGNLAFNNPNPKFREPERYDRLVKVISSCEGATWDDKFVAYAHKCGISDKSIAAFRKIMLED